MDKKDHEASIQHNWYKSVMERQDQNLVKESQKRLDMPVFWNRSVGSNYHQFKDILHNDGNHLKVRTEIYTPYDSQVQDSIMAQQLISVQQMNTTDDHSKKIGLKNEKKEQRDDGLLNNFVEPDSEITKVSYKDLMENIQHPSLRYFIQTNKIGQKSKTGSIGAELSKRTH